MSPVLQSLQNVANFAEFQSIANVAKLSKFCKCCRNKTNDLILNLTPENVTQHSRIVTTTRKGSSTPTKMSKIIGRQIH